MNTKAKGARAERRARDILEAAGYGCTRSGASLGAFDLIAMNAQGIRCVQVKSGEQYCSKIERELMLETPVPPNASREIWRFPDRCRAPLIEVL
jgi:Holliday junction resolvase